MATIPYVFTTSKGERLTIYTVAIKVSRGDSPPVMLQEGSRLRVRGYVATSHHVFFGEVAEVALGAGTPLIYAQRAYRNLGAALDTLAPAA